MFKIFRVENGYQIFWCPSAPMHYADKIPHSDKVYTYRQAAYRRMKQLEAMTHPAPQVTIAEKSKDAA